jgi:hypothetical protein
MTTIFAQLTDLEILWRGVALRFAVRALAHLEFKSTPPD